MTLFSMDQISYTQAGYMRLSNLATGAANSTVVTTPLTTLLSTASRAGGSLPLQASVSNGQGFYAAAPMNRCEISLTSNGNKITDGSSNEVYGRLTEASGVWTLRYYSMVNGVETAYAHAGSVNIDVILAYVFELSQMPVAAPITLGSYMIVNDPSSGGGVAVVERPTIVTLNTLPALTYSPANPANVKVIVRGQTLYPGGALPDFTVGGTGNKTLTWNSANAGYSLQPGWSVVYEYDRLV